MRIYFSLFIAALIIGIFMIILGIVYRKKWNQTSIAYLFLFGMFIVIVAGIMSLCLGFFMA